MASVFDNSELGKIVTETGILVEATEPDSQQWVHSQKQADTVYGCSSLVGTRKTILNTIAAEVEITMALLVSNKKFHDSRESITKVIARSSTEQASEVDLIAMQASAKECDLAVFAPCFCTAKSKIHSLAALDEINKYFSKRSHIIKYSKDAKGNLALSVAADLGILGMSLACQAILENPSL